MTWCQKGHRRDGSGSVRGAHAQGRATRCAWASSAIVFARQVLGSSEGAIIIRGTMTPRISRSWLRGPVEGIAPVLQPAAHALIQAQEEVAALAPTGLSTGTALARSTGPRPPGFTLLHLAGALDRLFTYARGEALDDAQKAAARAEAAPHPELDGAALCRDRATAPSTRRWRSSAPPTRRRSSMSARSAEPGSADDRPRRAFSRRRAQHPARRAVHHDGENIGDWSSARGVRTLRVGDAGRAPGRAQPCEHELGLSGGRTRASRVLKRTLGH